MNQVFTNQQNEFNFTKNYNLITASTKLTAVEKLLIARVLNWQQSNLKCTMSNQSLATEIGESLSTIKRTITKLNKMSFFKSHETSAFNEFGKWSNSKEIIIDEQALSDFITDKTPKAVSVQKVVQPAEIKAPEPILIPIEPEVIPDYFIDYDDELSEKELLEFVKEYNETYEGAKGRYGIINIFIKQGKVKTKNQILYEFEHDEKMLLLK